MTRGTVRCARYTSIIANLAFVAFLGCLIYNQARTLRWLHHVNPLWFFLGAVVIIVVAAILAELMSERDESSSARAGSQEGGSDPAKSPAGPSGGGQQASPAQAVPGATT